MTAIFVGLDGEMTGIAMERPGKLPHRLIQIGVAFGTDERDTFTSLISWPAGTFDWDDRAARVHLIPRTSVTGNNAAQVDAALRTWLIAHGGETAKLYPVGWNVTAFDMPFLRRDLPLSAELFQRRGVDLNSVVFALAKSTRRQRATNGLGYEGWMKASKRHAVDVLGYEDWHDAGYDARASLVAYDWLVGQLRAQ